MKSALILALFLVSTGATRAGNARSDRSMAAFQQEQYRRQVINQQWAAQIQRARMDQQSAREGYSTNPDNTPSRSYYMNVRSGQFHGQFRKPVYQYVPSNHVYTYTQRRR